MLCELLWRVRCALSPEPGPGAVLAKLCWEEGLTAAWEMCFGLDDPQRSLPTPNVLCWGVPSPTGRCTCDTQAYRPGALAVLPAD